MTQQPGYFVPAPPGQPGGAYRWHVPPPQPVSPGGVPLADFGTRLLAYLHRTGQTLGKRLMKIAVVPVDPARRLTRGMAVKRHLVEFVAGTFIPFLHYLDCLWSLRDKPYQQALHDKVAKTVVVKVSP